MALIVLLLREISSDEFGDSLLHLSIWVKRLLQRMFAA